MTHIGLCLTFATVLADLLEDILSSYDVCQIFLMFLSNGLFELKVIIADCFQPVVGNMKTHSSASKAFGKRLEKYSFIL